MIKVCHTGAQRSKILGQSDTRAPQCLQETRNIRGKAAFKPLPPLRLWAELKTALPLYFGLTPDELVKRSGMMVSIVGASGWTPIIGRVQLAPTCKARKSDGRGNPPGCPLSGGSASRPYLSQRRSCRATPQMEFLRDHHILGNSLLGGLAG